MAKYMQKRYHLRRAEAFEYLGDCCVVCGTKDQLEIDHINPEKKEISLCKLWSIAKVRFLEELDKCQLLCKQHHLEKSRTEGSLNKSWVTKPRLVHGSVWTYKHHKCRCAICVAAHGPERTPRQHGERRTYLRGCHCPECRNANAMYMKELRARSSARSRASAF